MPKNFEQETLELEQARISADLAYQREKISVYNKPLYSRKDLDALENKYKSYMFAAAFIGLMVGSFLMYASYHQ
jgi:hypothetical protein